MASVLYANSILDVAAQALWAATVELSNRVHAKAPVEALEVAQGVHMRADKNLGDAIALYLKTLFREGG